MSTYRDLLQAVQDGRVSVPEAEERLKHLHTEDLGFASVDHHRALRQGVPEVIFGQGKTREQIVAIVESLHRRDADAILVTRVGQEVYDDVREVAPTAVYHELARLVVVEARPRAKVGRIAVVCAGTSDLPVAHEAVYTAQLLGNHADLIADVGVAGIHRLFARMPEIAAAQVVIVIAGMEGALPSVVGGLVDKPLIAVPTSIGYGANFGGLSALLGMLNSCASGVTVVNIDNGFGAAVAASRINHLAVRA
ncbi:MAG: nickel pincer cofactor biosynthesis protein LarB [Firmicutes bacterium]|nr:nickel pincer cofactor biosynthesis protein LarB [Bacillota bacterium]